MIRLLPDAYGGDLGLVSASLALASAGRAGGRRRPRRRRQPASDLVARGKYVFGATGGCGCHTEKDRPVNSGGRKYDGPFGTVYSANITPDRQTGIGGWTDEQIITAIRLGPAAERRAADPGASLPVFNGMAEEDLRALVAFLRSLPPVNRPNTPKKITMPLFESVFLPAWLAAFAPRETPPPTRADLGAGARRVPRAGGGPLRRVPHAARGHAGDRQLAVPGRDSEGPGGRSRSQHHPDKDTGLTWSEEEIAEYLETGNKPDGDVAGGLMAEVIEGTAAGYKHLTKQDRLAIARYLKTHPRRAQQGRQAVTTSTSHRAGTTSAVPSKEAE